MIDSRVRRATMLGIPLYLVATGGVGVVLRRLEMPATAPILLAAAGPLLFVAWRLSRSASRGVYGPARRFWSHLGRANLALGGAFSAWAITILTEYRPLALVAMLLASLSALWYFSAVASRIKPIEGTGLAPLNLANLASILAAVGCYYLYAPFPLLTQKRGLSASLFTAIVLLTTSGWAYLLQVLFRRYGEHARPPDQILSIAVGSAMILSVANIIYLLTDGPMESAAVAFATLVVLSPLAIAPLAETGKSLQFRRPPNTENLNCWPIALSGVALIPLAIHLVLSSGYTKPWRVGIVLFGAGVVTTASISAQRALSRRAQAVTARQIAVESLYEKEAAKEAALLDILQRVAEGWSISDIVEGSLQAVVQTTSAQRALFFVLDTARNSVTVLGAVGIHRDELEEIDEKLDDPYALQRALRGGRTLTTVNTPIPGLSDTAARFGAVSFASTAISGWEKGSTAILCADSALAGSRFTEDDTRMMEAIADYVSLARSRMRLFSELAASEERYRVLVDESPDGVVELDTNARILFSNKVFAQMIGKEPVQLLGVSFVELLGIARWSAPKPGEIVRTTTAVEVEGQELILEIYQSTRRDGRVQAVLRNVTERHKSAQRLRLLYEELREKERLRTQTLAKLIKAEEDVRSRIAVDLHDGPVQEFSRLAIALDIAKQNLQAGKFQEGIDALAKIRKSLSTELLRLRSLMTQLRPPVLAERTLADAIETFCRSFENETGISVKIAAQRFDIDKSQEIIVYRIFQEAMANIKKHSFARHVHISLEGSRESGVRLSISDDGVGFDPSIKERVVEDGHIGLVSMMERAELAGGSCRVQSRPGHGTTVLVTIGGEVKENAG